MPNLTAQHSEMTLTEGEASGNYDSDTDQLKEGLPHVLQSSSESGTLETIDVCLAEGEHDNARIVQSGIVHAGSQVRRG